MVHACLEMQMNRHEDESISDEEALCLMNPEYSCVTCANVECEYWGERFRSCPYHVPYEEIKNEQ